MPLSADKISAVDALGTVSAYLQDPANGAVMSALMDSEAPREDLKGGLFGGEDRCTASWSNKHASIVEGLPQEARISFDKIDGRTSVTYGAATGTGTAALITVSAPSDKVDCDIPTTPQELEDVTEKLIKDKDSTLSTTFTETLEDAENQILAATKA